MTRIDFGSHAWHEAKHTAGFLARGHIPLEARCDWPYDLECDGGTRRCYGYVMPDLTQKDEPGFDRTYAVSVMVGMPKLPVVAPQRNGSTDDDDQLARFVDGWTTIEFLELWREAVDLMKSRRWRRLAIAVYERLSEVEVLDQDDLMRIYEQEHGHATQAA